MGFVPPGFRFVPTAEEIFMFLRMKVKGKPLPHNEVGESDIYGNKEPWILFNPTVKKQFFVFTKLKKKSKSRMDRVVGCGTWKTEHTQEVRDRKNNKVIGLKKSFVFKYTKNKAKGTDRNGHWIMEEFSLRDYSKVEDFDEYVLCKIRNRELDKMKHPIRNFQHHAHSSNDRQVAVVETDEINQSNDEIKRYLSLRDENLVLEQTNPIAFVPVSSSSSYSAEIYASNYDQQVAVMETNEMHQINDEIKRNLSPRDENPFPVAEQTKNPVAAVLVSSSYSAQIYASNYDQQIAVMETNEMHQNNDEIKRHLSLRDENPVLEQTNPIAFVPVSSSYSAQIYASNYDQQVAVMETNEMHQINDEIKRNLIPRCENPVPVAEQTKNPVAAVLVSSSYSAQIYASNYDQQVAVMETNEMHQINDEIKRNLIPRCENPVPVAEQTKNPVAAVLVSSSYSAQIYASNYDQQVAVMETNEMHQINDEIKRNTIPRDENPVPVAEQTKNPIADVLVSSSSAQFYATTSPPLVPEIIEDDEIRALSDNQLPPTYMCDLWWW